MKSKTRRHSGGAALAVAVKTAKGIHKKFVCHSDTMRRSDFIVCQQELSYRQQIARKLRTEYAEGIHRHKYCTVTLKSR